MIVISEQEVRRLLLSQIFLKVTADGETANGNVNPGEYSLTAATPTCSNLINPETSLNFTFLNKLCVIFYIYNSNTAMLEISVSMQE